MMAMTAAMPMSTPSSVKNERILLVRRLVSARKTDSLILTGLLPQDAVAHGDGAFGLFG